MKFCNRQNEAIVIESTSVVAWDQVQRFGGGERLVGMRQKKTWELRKCSLLDCGGSYMGIQAYQTIQCK